MFAARAAALPLKVFIIVVPRVPRVCAGELQARQASCLVLGIKKKLPGELSFREVPVAWPNTALHTVHYKVSQCTVYQIFIDYKAA